MKLSTAVIAALAAAVNVDAKKTLDSKTLRKTMNNVSTKQALLRRARKLEQGNGEFEITSDYFIKFNSCASLKILDVEDVSTYITNSQYSGSNVDVNSLNIYKDYIVFDATSASSGQTVQYVIDVDSYVQTLIQAIPNDYEEYCDTCEDAYETCAASSVSAAGADEGGRRRKLTTNYEYVDCDLCYANGCFYQFEKQDGGEEGGQGGGRKLQEGEGSVYTDSYGYTSSDALEWLEGVTECQEISQDNGYVNFNGYYTLYAGLTCNAAGTGVEISLYANQDCTIQSTQTTFYNILSSETQINSYFELTKSLVEKSFTQTTSCAETTFVNPYEENNGNRRRRLKGDDEEEEEEEGEQDQEDANEEDGNMDENQDEENRDEENQDENQDANQDENADEEAAEDEQQAEEEEEEEEEKDNDPVNEICQALTEDSFTLNDCDDDAENSYQYDADGNAWGTYYYGSYGYISYDITDAEDAEQICMAMKKKSGYYNRVGSGSSTKLYNYNGRKTNTYTWDLYSGSSTNGYNPNGSSSNSGGGSSGSGNGGFDFNWEDTKQNIGNKYNEYTEKVGNGINRASEQTGLEVEEIIGVIVGALAALCIFIACGCYCCCKKTNPEDEKQVNLLATGEERERKEWKSKDKWESTRNKATWA